MKEFETPEQKSFWAHQIKQDNKFIARIERAGRAGDLAEIRRQEKAWRKEEAKDRKEFNKRVWKND